MSSPTAVVPLVLVLGFSLYLTFGYIAGILHTIVFNRALGPCKPQEVDSELFDITYVSYN